MNQRVTAQLRVIKAVVSTLEASGISAWLFGGWGLDARIGRITREHGDVEFWVERTGARQTAPWQARAAPRMPAEFLEDQSRTMRIPGTVRASVHPSGVKPLRR